MKQKNEVVIGYGLVILAGIFWGTSGTFGSILMNSGVEPGLVGIFRLGIGACVLGCIMLFTKPSLFKLSLRGFLGVAAMGLVSQTIFNYTYFRAISLTTPATAVVLLYTSPVFLLIFGMIFYKEKLTVRKTLAVVLCLTGCYLTATEGNPANLIFDGIGLFYGLCAGLAYSLVTIFSKALLKLYETLTIVFYSFVFGSLGLIIPSMPFNMGEIVWNTKIVFALAGVSLISATFAYLCYVNGLSKGVEASRAGVLASFEVISGVTLSFLVLGESMGVYKLFGVAAVFGSILLVNQRNANIFKEDVKENITTSL